LTDEVVQQLKSWLDYKYRTRRVCYQDKQIGKVVTEYRAPDKKDSDLVFAVMPYLKYMLKITIHISKYLF
jgi:hypothetical protein